MNDDRRDIEDQSTTTQTPVTQNPVTRDETQQARSGGTTGASDIRDTGTRSDLLGGTGTGTGTSATAAGSQTSTDSGFLPHERMNDLRRRWDDIQAGFVDDPRSAVQNAQQLVGDMVTELTETFSRERGVLEGQWGKGGDADTEALRVALQRYRSFFNRLLNT